MGNPNEHLNWIDWTIANTANLSDAHRSPGQNLVGLIAPIMTALTTALQLQASPDDFYNVAAPTWYDVRDQDGTLVKVVVSATVVTYAEVDPISLQAARQLRFKAVRVDGTTVQAQTGAKVGKFALRPYV